MKPKHGGIVFVAVAAVAILLISLNSHKLQSKSSVQGPHASAKGVEPATNASPAIQAPLPTHVGHLTSPIAPSPALQELRSLAVSRDMVELLHAARKTSNIDAQEFAVDAPTLLCFSLVLTRNAGFTPLVESRRPLLPSVMKVLQPTTSLAFADTAASCGNYSQEGKLRDDLATEFMAKDTPVASAKRAFGSTSDSSQEVKTSSQLTALQRVLDSESGGAPGIFLLKAPLASAIKSSLFSTLPEELREDAVQIAMSGIELGVCRSNFPCGPGSVARASICAKYGECSSADVETAIKNLHVLYGVPFEHTSHVAGKVAQAIQAKDASALFTGK
jgi:hypothetical protein